RLFAGHEHELQVKRIADHFNQSVVKYRTISFNPQVFAKLKGDQFPQVKSGNTSELLKKSLFAARDLSGFESDEEAYHQLIIDIITQQYASTQLVLKGTSAKRIFVDGGFSKNAIYMNLIAVAFPDIEVFAASMAQATAVGSALAIHSAWNTKALPNDIIELKYYSQTHNPLV
ncbi:MAG TPA: carbohydrate kinase, partial [Sphingobacteriaceae bacterium]